MCSVRPDSSQMLQNEHKEVKVDEILGRAEAEKAIKEAMVRIHLYSAFWLQYLNPKFQSCLDTMHVLGTGCVSLALSNKSWL